METIDSRNTRVRPAGMWVLLHGLILGIVCCVLAEAMVPCYVATPSQHDLALAIRLGFIYPTVIGLWFGWTQRSWGRAAWGVAIGIVIGILYFFLCEQGMRLGGGFVAIMVAFPCLCGGVMAAGLGLRDDDWSMQVLVRLARGLFSGFVMGLTYMIVLNVNCCAVTQGAVIDPAISTRMERFVQMMRIAGPPALGIASAIFVRMLLWSVKPLRRKYPPGCCLECGYDLTGNESGACSECGAKVISDQAALE